MSLADSAIASEFLQGQIAVGGMLSNARNVHLPIGFIIQRGMCHIIMPHAEVHVSHSGMNHPVFQLPQETLDEYLANFNYQNVFPSSNYQNAATAQKNFENGRVICHGIAQGLSHLHEAREVAVKVIQLIAFDFVVGRCSCSGMHKMR